MKRSENADENQRAFRGQSKFVGLVRDVISKLQCFHKYMTRTAG